MSGKLQVREGFELFEWLRSHNGNSQVRFYFTTAKVVTAASATLFGAPYLSAATAKHEELVTVRMQGFSLCGPLTSDVTAVRPGFWE